MSKKLPSNNSLRASLIALTIGFAGCGSQVISTSFSQTASINENLPQVVATTSVLCDLIKQVAENTVNLTCLISPDRDPYVYQPNSEDRKAIEQANLILYNGYNLEPRLIKIIKATKNSAPKIAVAQLALPRPQQFRQGSRRVADPHIWHNVKNTISMVEVISNNLKKLEPNNAVTYSDNASEIKNQLLQIDSWIKSRIASIPPKQRKLMTTNNALSYYAKAYGLSLGTIEGTSTEDKPTATQLKNSVKDIQQAKVPTIFAETTTNPELIQSLAQDAEVKVSERELYADGLGESRSDADTYQKMMIANTRTIVEGLGGTYLRFEAKAP
ncbi:zinc ABC transporter substrate-binding protein [Nostocaceae cyanobacterium CENA369]|uniref:Zinc ABC transporter substrate-binding protein n=1 Tax=Dendronalium phyllosphericum CENA369 TaxID=1725256 RepID=A0A8J7LDA3_9NOST|nr:zinc ABC transporter substrate-binding protein [Dendronalium phyllosphericum]MBH8571783.1 zinc ABC transporter substrate-binding protein [Dendronalium phyllosphericum CENA369]